jgi:hypothetical protein
MWKNGANTAMDIKTFGNSNSNVNSDVLIRIDSCGDPTPGANVGTIKYNINGSDKHIMTGSSFGINTITPGSYALNVNGNIYGSGSLTTGNIAAIKGTSEADTATLFLATPFTPTSAYKCALIAQGLTTYSRSKLHICLNNTADNSTAFNASLSDYCAAFNYNGNVGIGNNNPLDDGGASTFLCVGDSSITSSFGVIVVAQNNGSGTRHFCIRQDGGFNACIGDFGSNNAIGTFTPQLVVSWQCPAYSLTVNNNGSVYMAYGYSGSDMILKTDIEPIENALWKVQQLGGVEYTLISEHTRYLGVIAQEVENIIPEVVNINDNGIKGVSYNGIVGLLINAITEQQTSFVLERAKRVEQQEEINNLKNILKNNNLY